VQESLEIIEDADEIEEEELETSLNLLDNIDLKVSTSPKINKHDAE